MPNVVQQWKDWYSGDTDPPPYIAGYGNFWLNTTTKGVWEKTGVSTWVLRGFLFDPTFGNGLKEISFSASDWAGNRITVIPTGVPMSPGEIGPHMIPPRTLWPMVMEVSGTFAEEVSLKVVFDPTTGRVTIWKTGLVPAFAGIVGLRYVP
jgi:hypothetical protein